MAEVNSQTKAKNKHNTKNYDNIRIVVQNGKKILKSMAEKQEESLNWYTKKTLQAKILDDTGKGIEL